MLKGKLNWAEGEDKVSLLLAWFSNSPTQQKVASIARGRSKRVSAMTEKMITLKFILPEALAVAFGIIILIGIVYLTHKYPVPTVQADANHSAGGSLRKR